MGHGCRPTVRATLEIALPTPGDTGGQKENGNPPKLERGSGRRGLPQDIWRRRETSEATRLLPNPFRDL